jgi:hypothetical protein
MLCVKGALADIAHISGSNYSKRTKTLVYLEKYVSLCVIKLNIRLNK